MTKDPFTVEVESLDLEGRGVARRAGKVVFVEGALPGERVRATALRVKPAYETARLLEVLRAAPMRVVPRCRHFGLHQGACGGCSMQHLDPRGQLAIKQRALEDSLWHVGRLRADTILRPVGGADWHYRHRARLTVRHVAKKGGVLVGFHERASSYVADMTECPVLPVHLSDLLVPLRELIGRLSVRDRLPQIEVAIAGRGETVVTVLVLRVLVDPTGEDRQRLLEFAHRHAVTFWLQPGGPASAAPLDPDTEVQLVLRLPESGVELPFAPTDFTQVNHGINEILVRRVLALLDPQPHERIVDFFCGLGNFTVPLARRSRRVTGLDGSAMLLARAAQAAGRNGLAGAVDFAAHDLFAWSADDLAGLHAEHGAIDAVLIDPPREGALAVVRSFARASRPPRRIVYVSCNPATLARDCAVLVHDGRWRLRAAGVVNMFPHTSHVESIVTLEPPVHAAV